MRSVDVALSSVIIAVFSIGCSYVSSKGEYTLGKGSLVVKQSATLTLKVSGVSRNTEISQFVIEAKDEQNLLSDYSSNAAESAIDKEFKENVKSSVLPWSTELILDADEVLYLQVRPIDFDGKVAVEIWKEGKLQKEYSITNNMLAFWTSYRL